MNNNSLKGLFQNLAKPIVPSMTIGVVTADDPLRITLKYEPGVNLSAQSLIIPSEKQSWLEVGAEFYMLSVNNNKMYYILDRT